MYIIKNDLLQNSSVTPLKNFNLYQLLGGGIYALTCGYEAQGPSGSPTPQIKVTQCPHSLHVTFLFPDRGHSTQEQLLGLWNCGTVDCRDCGLSGLWTAWTLGLLGLWVAGTVSCWEWWGCGLPGLWTVGTVDCRDWTGGTVDCWDCELLGLVGLWAAGTVDWLHCGLLGVRLSTPAR